MPVDEDIPSASLGLALGILLIAAFLGLRQWYERRARDLDLSVADRAHFMRQDARRGLGVAVLLAIAALAAATARLAPKVGGKGNPAFAELWLIILALIIVLLTLALIDWLATRAYARRHRQEMIRESFRGIRQEERNLTPGDDELTRGPEDTRPSDSPPSSG